MKKDTWLAIAVVLGVAGLVALAAPPLVTIPNEAGPAKIKEVCNSNTDILINHKWDGTNIADGTITTNDMSSSAKMAFATNRVRVEFGKKLTGEYEGALSSTFSRVFSALPTVVVTYEGSISSNIIITNYPHVSLSNFTLLAPTSYSWIAVGVE